MAGIGGMLSNVMDSFKGAITNGFDDWKNGDTQNGLGAGIVGVSAVIAAVVGYNLSGGFGQAGGSLFGIIPVVMLVGSLVGSIINQPIQSMLAKSKDGDEHSQGPDLNVSRGQGHTKVPSYVPSIDVNTIDFSGGDADGLQGAQVNGADLSEAVSPKGAPVVTGDGSELKAKGI